MLMTGEAAASFALEHEIPFVFSTNSTPPQESPGEAFSARYAARRSLLRSQYRVTPDPHQLIGLDAYAQVTSPLRRYLDLVNHQQLRAFLTGREALNESELLERIGEVEAILGSVRNAERASRDHWTLVYLHQNQDWEGEGVFVEERRRRGVFLVPVLAMEAEISLRRNLSLDDTVQLKVGSIDLPQRRANFRIQK
jgi:exoribonuclease-2